MSHRTYWKATAAAALAGLALASASSAAADQVRAVAPEAAVGASARAERDGFGAMILITPDRQAFRSGWYGAWPPKLNATTRAYRGKPVHAMIVFSGCRPAADGNCNVSARFSVIAPAGTTYADSPGGRIWIGKPAAAGRMLLGEGALGFRLDSGDALGSYIFKSVVTDNVAGTSLLVEQPVTALETP